MTGIYQLADLQRAIANHPQQWRPLVFTNGCFDLIHVGHVRYLQTAKTLGNALVVAVNSDCSVQAIKPVSEGNPPRPINPVAQRAEVVAALRPVDAVVIFSQTTAIHLLQTLQPEIYVKGGDYTVETLPEAPVVRAYGGKIELVKVEVASSTTAMIHRILNTVR